MAKVLIIDDDESVTRLLQTQLVEDGHSVAIAHDGSGGLAQASSVQPDLIMLDVFLPDCTGFQMCSQLRKNPATQHVPIIMMTGAARFSNQQLMGLQRGANEYIFKPFNIVEVDELIQKYIGSKTLSFTTSTSPQDRLGSLSSEALEPAPELDTQIFPDLMPEMPEPVAFAEPAPRARAENRSDDLKALGSFINQALSKGKVSPVQIPSNENKLGTNGYRRPSVMMPETAPEPNPDFQPPVRRQPAPVSHEEPLPEAVKIPQPTPVEIPAEPAPVRMKLMPEEVVAAAKAPTPAHAGSFSVSILASKERFVEFGLEIFELATRLCSNHAEKHVSDHLLRTSLGVGQKITESRFCQNQAEYMDLLNGSIKDLREVAYWLSIVRKAGLLDLLKKPDLEKNCQSLTTLLGDFVNSERKRLHI